MRNLIFWFFLTSALSPFTASSTILHDDLRCMPVLIQIPLPDGIHSSYGTGVYLSDSNRLFLVTAAHVIFDLTNAPNTLINSNAILSSCVRGSNLNDRAVLSLDLKILSGKGLLKHHPSRDIAAIPIATFNQTTNFERSGILSPGVEWRSNSKVVPWSANEVCKKFSNVLCGDDAYILGYPVSLFVRNRYEDIDLSEPLVRKGIVSQKNQKSGRLIVDSAVYHGNSGGPALTSDQTPGAPNLRLAGVVIKYVPVVTDVDPGIGVTNSAFVNSGYGVVEPIDYALELIRQ